MKNIMHENEFKKYGKYISQIVSTILKNKGKFPRYTLATKDEYQFFVEIKPVIEKKIKCEVEIIPEKDSKDKRAEHALPGRPSIVIS